MYEYRGFVTKIIDGDSLAVSLDLGFHTHRDENLRLFGINCPEKNTPEGKAAAKFTAAWLALKNNDVTVRTMKDGQEKYGRYLAFISHGSECLNDELVKAGHAVFYNGGKR